jgi:uncharacterized hydrophobic protein (TIGR00271 family)
MTGDTQLHDPAPDDGATPEMAADLDLPGHERLLGVPWTSFMRARALRGVGLVVLALVILLWPDRTDRVLAFLVGIGLTGYAGVTLVDVARHAQRRVFPTMVSIAVAGGLAAALITEPSESLTTVTQALGGALIAAAAFELGHMAWRRRPSAWVVSKSIGLVAAGGLLIASPDRLLTAATSIAAAVLGAAGVIDVFHPEERPTDGEVATPASTAVGGTLAAWLQQRPYMTEDRNILKTKVFFEGPTAPTRFARFAALMLFAAVIASVGVVVESTAVVIGAMLIAPLMVPLMGTALAVAMGWPRRLRRCAGISLTGVLLAVATGAVAGAVMPRTVDVTANTEIVSRISPTVVDLAIAVAAGAAGAYALSRRDVSESLPGVAVAIALVPPLTVVGLCWQQGAWAAGNGALLLFLTNATAILIAGGAMFVLVGAVPLYRVSESQQRLGTVIVGLLSFAAVVVVLLVLNGAQLARTDLARAGTDQALADWSARHEDHRVIDQRVKSDGTLVVDLAGPGRPPELDALVDDLRAALGDDVPLQVHWIEQQQVIVDD